MRDGSKPPEAQDVKPLLKQVRFITALTADPEVKAYGKAVANALVFVFWNRGDGYARPGHAALAKASGLGVSTVRKGIDSLKERGWLAVEPQRDQQGDQAPNHYFPIWKRAEVSAPAGSERPKKAAHKKAAPIAMPGITVDVVEAAAPVTPVEPAQAAAPPSRPVQPAVRSMPRPLHRPGPSLPAFEGTYAKINIVNVNRWSREFTHISNIIAVMHEIDRDLSTVPENERTRAMGKRLQERNQQVGASQLAVADADFPF